MTKPLTAGIWDTVGEQRTVLRGGMVLGTRADTGSAQREEEARLLVEAGRGDVDALRALYRSFEKPLYNLGLRWLQDAALAEELVQEVTLRVWRRASMFDPARGAASSWIFGIARNVAADLARARSRAPVPVGEPVGDGSEPWNEEAAWRQWEIGKAVQTLPVERRQVVLLAYVHQFTQSEIAKALGVPLGTVKTRLYQGLRQLRASLIEMGIVEERRGEV
jgi:RNA polymerase sigma-70 factor (ECF subfamily)